MINDGKTHQLYGRKSHVFDAFASQNDEVVVIRKGSKILASNTMSTAQLPEKIELLRCYNVRKFNLHLG